MTIFEYLMVLVSIVLGFALTQLLRGLAKFLRSDNRELAITLWALFLFLICLQNWWAFWDLRNIEDWTQYKFIFVAMIPIMLFISVELLVPMSTTAETNWSQHYRSVRVWFAAAGLMLVFLATLMSWYLMQIPWTHPYRLMQAGIMLSFSVGFFTSDERALRIAPMLALATLITGQVLFRILPDLA